MASSFSSRIKTGAFLLEALNAISTTFYFYHVFFFLEERFGFAGRQNLAWAIGQGSVYVVAAWQGGRLGQRRGYLWALRLGFAGMSICFLCGWLLHFLSVPRAWDIGLQVILMLLATVFICFTWPNLEAMVSEGEPGSRLQRLLGIYNLIWSGFCALAYFVGGALIETWGAPNQVFLVPALMIGAQWWIATRLERWAGGPAPQAIAPHGVLSSHGERRRSSLPPQAFLRLSWFCNPCAYIAIFAVIPLIPSLANHLGLSPRTAGFFCSIWIFSRTLTFLGLWRWNGWHYRFRWLAVAYVGMMVGFLFIFLSVGWPNLARWASLGLCSISQVVFGASIGLIYYSSLFYSMDVGDTKGDHGGIHEAAIGVGILGGPVVGAAAQFAHPGSLTAAAWAVTGVLSVGLCVVLWMRATAARRTENPPSTPT